MAKNEIKTYTITDDFDGAELPEKTRAVRYRFDDTSYDLYLSKENKATVDKFIKDLVTGAEVVTRQNAATGVEIKDGFTIEDLREWAKANFDGTVSPNRRASRKAIEAFNAAH